MKITMEVDTKMLSVLTQTQIEDAVIFGACVGIAIKLNALIPKDRHGPDVRRAITADNAHLAKRAIRAQVEYDQDDDDIRNAEQLPYHGT